MTCKATNSLLLDEANKKHLDKCQTKSRRFWSNVTFWDMLMPAWIFSIKPDLWCSFLWLRPVFLSECQASKQIYYASRKWFIWFEKQREKAVCHTSPTHIARGLPMKTKNFLALILQKFILLRCVKLYQSVPSIWIILNKMLLEAVYLVSLMFFNHVSWLLINWFIFH